jgi:hypothetical protein
MQPRRPPSLPSTCGVFPGLSSFPHFERDPRGPDVHSRLGKEMAHGARKSKECDTVFNRAPYTLGRVPSAGLPGETMRRMVP